MEYEATPDGSYSFSEHFCRDGRWEKIGGYAPISGTYEIDGEVFCVMRYGDESRLCRRIVSDGDVTRAELVSDSSFFWRLIEVHISPDDGSCF